ncbi:hypothetical protein JIQ42_04714 [Leishmania sp. Namibia]|uniref:hypothetical protein n=1 Tax=Leishmania sp. Namibia TaxID=2802991 RepID=UPI001B6AA200|nr:hypothetical protein JIQ42_04714 [Leishmania sp. Namibia]
MSKVRTMESEGRWRLSPGDTRSRGQREADLFTCLRPPSAAGTHSVWCNLVLVEVGCRPLEATNVVFVVTRSKALLRVVATGFLFTVHLQDIVQVRHVVPAHAVELHVKVPLNSLSEEHLHPEREEHVTLTHRLYRVYPKKRGRHCTSTCAELFRLMTPLLPVHAQQVSEESDLDDAFAWYERVDARSMLPRTFREEVGLRELESISHLQPHTPFSAGVARLAATSAEAQRHPPTWRQARSALSLESPCRGFLAPADLFDDADVAGHLRRIYVVPSPGFWRLSTASSPPTPPNFLSCEKRGPPDLHHDASAGVASRCTCSSPVTMRRQYTSARILDSCSTFFATSAPAPRHQPQLKPPNGAPENERPMQSSPYLHAGMNSPESSLPAGACSLRPFTASTPPFPLPSSARSP